MYDDLALTSTTTSGRSQSWAAEFPVDTRPITLDADLVLARYTDGVIPSGALLGLNATTGRYGPYGGTTDEKQTVTITGTPTGGTFTLTYAGQTTAAIAYNATAATVQTRLEALSTIGAGNVTVTGGPGPGTAWVVTFAGDLADTNVAQMTSTDSLTGGSSPASAISTTTAGGADIASDGTQVARGHLLSGAYVRAGKHVPAALYYKGRVYRDLLPSNSGIDDNAVTDLTLIAYDKVSG